MFLPTLKRYWRPSIIFVVILASILVRLPYLTDISYWWRSDQTLMSSFWMEKEGISLFHYQTPLFGPPWEVPFEFPLYQAFSALASLLVFHNITLASHVVSLISFYVSAVFLLLLCDQYFNKRIIGLIVLSVYLWSPYNIRYSTEILIDFMALAFALGFLYFLNKWLEQTSKIYNLGLGVLFCCLGAVVKITTMPVIVIPVLVSVYNFYFPMGIKADLQANWIQKLWEKVYCRKAETVLLFLSALLPLALAVIWTRYTDHIKVLNIYTRWLTSGLLNDWTYGTWPQKLSLVNWLRWIVNIIRLLTAPGILIIFPFIALVERDLKTVKSRVFITSVFLGIFLTIFIFFNLYLHDYYYISITPWMAVLIGFGIYVLYTKFLLGNRFVKLIGLFVLSLVVVLTAVQIQQTRIAVIKEIASFKATQMPLSQKAREVTPAGVNIISIQSDWYPATLLYAERKGLIISFRERKLFTCDDVKDGNYGTVIGPADDRDTKMVLSCFHSIKQIDPQIFVVQ